MTKPNYIAGEWVPGADAAENRNPSDLDDLVGIYARASAEQTRDAIAAARAAFPGWAQTGPQTRADILDTVGAELFTRRNELGALLAREEGKILAEGIGEVTRAAQLFRFYAQESLRIEGVSIASSRPGVRVEVRHEPVGVVGVITPWNFPIAIPAWKIAPALAFGNTVVFKPADLTPGSAWALAEILSRAGLPAGVFNLVMGRGSVVGDVIAHAPDVNAVTFTGSEATGRGIRRIVAERGGKVQQEMGGKARSSFWMTPIWITRWNVQLAGLWSLPGSAAPPTPGSSPRRASMTHWRRAWRRGRGPFAWAMRWIRQVRSVPLSMTVS